MNSNRIRRRVSIWLLSALLMAACLQRNALAQRAYTWAEIRDRFEVSNPTLLAARIAVDEARAQEITAFLRPNPDVTATIDQLDPVPDPFSSYPYRPLSMALPLVSGSYLHERQHKRELRRDSARTATAISASQAADQERTLLFNLHNAFVQTLQQKMILAVARESLSYYDRLLAVSRERFRAGDIAKVDLTRLELQRVQFETDVQTALVNLRTAKIQLLALLNDRSPIDGFDIAGQFDFPDQLASLEEFRSAALEARPDLRAAMQAVEKAQTDHRLAIANGSTDPTFGVDFGRNPPIPFYFGASITIPVRVFDRNQGEKLRTQQDISRSERLREANQVQVFSDVDSAYTTLNGNLTLLRPYKTTYLQQAVEVRDTVSFAYERGGSSLLDFLQAQQDYRSIQLNYLNLVGAFLSAANQMNLAAGREVMP